MKSATPILVGSEDTIICEIHIAAPPERVFAALTDPAQLAKWFTNPECPVKTWKMDARKGGVYSYSTAKGSHTLNGVDEFKCYGEILEYSPPHILAYTWIANWHRDKLHPTVVRWELAPLTSGTHVKVTHSGLAQEQVARDDYRGGWPGVVQMLKKFTEQT